MIGQQLDYVWTHIKHITEIKDTHHRTGISRDLVYFALKSLGLDAFDQFENSNLIEYILGQGDSGSAFYNVPVSQSLVTASNAGSIAKQDITKEVYKRLYHNVPYLLKTKGTERGLRALMNCYGIPATLLNVKEYGGPTKDVDVLSAGYKVFSYEKASLAVKGTTNTTAAPFIKTLWSSSLTDALSASAKTIEVRIKPKRTTLNNQTVYPIISLNGYGDEDQVHLNLEYDDNLNDISSSNDASQYGRLTLYTGSNVASSDRLASSSYFPIFNGDFWNIHLSTEGTSGSSANINFGAYQANFNKNISSYTGTYLQPEYHRALTFGDPFSSSGAFVGGGFQCQIAGEDTTQTLGYSGSIQEVRYYFGEALSVDTLNKHALEPFMYAGNTTSSAYDNLVLRLPLGSNDKQDSSSFHPNIDVNYLQANEGKEQVTNGDFSISKSNFNFGDASNGFFGDSGITISNGVLNLFRGSGFTGRAYLTNAAGDGHISTDLTFGRQYILRYTVVENDTNAQLRLYNGLEYLPANSTVGTHEKTFTYTDGSGGTDPVVLQNNGGTGTTIKLDNVSIKEKSRIVSGPFDNPVEWEETVETHHLPTPDTVGISMTSEKVRTDEGVIDDNILSVKVKSETSALDRQPQDFEDLGVFFSPTTEINEDIVYQLGTFRLDDFIGSPLPSAQTASDYKNLEPLRKEYFKRYKRKYNYWDYTKLIQYIDHTIFKLIEQFVPAKANLKTGLLIEPHYLERNKFARELPVIEDGQTMTPGSYNTLDFQIDPEKQFTIEGSMGGGNVVTTNNLLRYLDEDGLRKEQGTNGVIDLDDYVLDEPQEAAQAPIRPNSTGSKSRKRISNTLLGNAVKGRKSSRYYYSKQVGNQSDIVGPND